MRQTMGDIICELRSRKGLTQQELADRMGITRPAVTKMEKNRINIPSARIQQLAEIFGVPPGRFFPKHDPASIASDLMTIPS